MYALDNFDGRIPDDEIEFFINQRPHPDAVFDAEHWSRNDLENRSLRHAWRLVYACKAGCVDAISSIAVPPDDELPTPLACPDCDGSTHRLERAWDMPWCAGRR